MPDIIPPTISVPVGTNVANTRLGALPSWVSTLIGALIPALTGLSYQLPPPWNMVVGAVVGIIGLILGISVPGPLVTKPPPSAAPAPTP